MTTQHDLSNNILATLKKLSRGNASYAAFNARIVKTQQPVLGVRMPALRALATELAPTVTAKDLRALLRRRNVPFEYTLLCGLLITHAKISDAEAITLLRRYLSQADCWAHIDTIVEKKRRFAGAAWWDFAVACLSDSREFAVRYGIVSLLANFLDEKHLNAVFARLRGVTHSGYYVKMALAWAYATAAVDFFEQTLCEVSNTRLDPWVARKSCQKMRESRRFTPAQQNTIRALHCQMTDI